MHMGMFGERLKQLRESLGLSQRELARLVGISPPNISRYESGKITPTEDVIRQIAEKLSVSTDYLLGLTDDPTPKSGELPGFVREKLRRLEELEKEREKLLMVIDILKKHVEKLG